MGGIEISLKKLTNDISYKYSEKLQKVESGTLHFEIIPRNFEFSSYGNLKTDPKLVIQKLKASKKYKAADDETIIFLAKILSDSELLKEKYLSMNWTESISTHRKMSKIFNFEDDFIEITQDYDKLYDKM